MNTDTLVRLDAPFRPVPCSGAVVEGLYWAVPYILQGKVAEYRLVAQAAKPSPDSIRIMRVNSEGNTYFLAVADDAVVGDFANACNECCDNGTPSFGFVGTLPEATIEDEPTVDENGNRTWLFPLHSVESGQGLQIKGSLDGVAFSLDNGGAGYANAAALVAGLEDTGSDVDDKGIWSVDGNNVKFVSSTVVSAGAAITLVEKQYCATISFPVTFNKITHNGVVNTLPVAVTAANMSQLVGAIAAAGSMADGALTQFSSTKLNYKGTGVPSILQNGGSTVVTFSAGACANPTTTAPATTTTV